MQTQGRTIGNKMKNNQRLSGYMKEANLHINRLKKTLKALPYPFEPKDLDEEILDKLDVLAFRFSKLQSLVGEKLFREYLSLFYDVEGKSFLELLKLLEKEGITDIDTWSEIRKIRNFISHDYPLIDEEKVKAINFLIENLNIIFEIVEKIESRLNEIDL